jgi:hypothetical protein
MTTAIDIKRPDPFAAYASAVRSRTFDGLLLKFSKGDWLAGPDSDPVEEGTQLVAIMSELRIGWQKWQDHKQVDTNQDHWDEDDDGERKDPWQKVNQLPLISRGSKTIYTFATSTRGGIDAVAALCEDFAEESRIRPGRYPGVALGVDSYVHSNRKYGRVKIPRLEVIEYIDAARPDKTLAIARGAAPPSPTAEIEAPKVAEPPKASPEPKRGKMEVQRAAKPVEFDDDIPF